MTQHAKKSNAYPEKGDNIVTFLSGNPINVHIPDDDGALHNLIVDDLNRAAQAWLSAGLRLLALKARSPRGKFKSAVDSIGIEYRQACRLMQAADFVSKLDPKESAKLVKQPLLKIIPYARLGQELFDEAIKSGEITLEDLPTKTVAEVDAESRRWQRKAEKAEADNATLRTALNQPDSKAAWIERAERAEKEMGELSALVQARLEDFVQVLDRWSNGKVVGHGHSVNKYVGLVWMRIESMDAAVAKARAKVDTALTRMDAERKS